MRISQVISLFVFFILVSGSLNAQKKKYYDGPYISYKKDNIKLQWIQKGKSRDSIVDRSSATVFDRNGLPKVDLTKLDPLPYEKAHFDDVEKWVAISDIHGQHDLFLDLLIAQKVVDQDGKWIYGKGHLVVIGDVFDRGDKVTESLWFLFGLEHQAKAAGGKVHMLLGNHELMVIHDDLRYIHPKYVYTQGKLKTPYNELFDEGTVLGDWLRTKPISITINEVVFVHGGFTKEVLEKTANIDNINSLFRKNLYSEEDLKKSEKSLVDLLYFEKGPLWYRGYANPEGFGSGKTDEILKLLGKSSIVVGHTSMPQIISLHDNRIFLVDSSIKFGTTGEILVYEKENFYRGLLSGDKISVNDKSQNRSPFEYVYDLNDKDLKMTIITDIDRMLADKKEELWQNGILEAYHNDEFNRSWDIKLRARGNMRKLSCGFPPLKIDFSKSTLKYLGFSQHDKLKLVLPCNDESEYQQNLYKEYLCYKLYEVIDSLSIRVRLVDIELADNKSKTVYDLVGFSIEDDKDYTARTGGKIVKKGTVTSGAFARDHILKFSLFQLMIMNQDWGFSKKHNIKIVSLPNQENVHVVPYDFDYAGIVDQPYAALADELSFLKNLKDKFFRISDANLEEVQEARKFYLSIRDELLAVIDDSDEILNKANRKKMKSDILDFYELLEDQSAWEELFHLKKD